ncbi:hypothetical protein [Janthinobacterium sp. B9-8]|uniref:hypothetical protein n=1 Tax=Janthinobacterium sp. B9-8 TaxID=1236179 RepID=UPI00061D29F8|nr:hypothetical protein [Janthinobacterium sp. B9-8]AMC36610.1 hypothetical protein VN23_19450 [Janthinobacterium sp. B9-8]
MLNLKFPLALGNVTTPAILKAMKENEHIASKVFCSLHKLLDELRPHNLMLQSFAEPEHMKEHLEALQKGINAQYLQLKTLNQKWEIQRELKRVAIGPMDIAAHHRRSANSSQISSLHHQINDSKEAILDKRAQLKSMGVSEPEIDRLRPIVPAQNLLDEIKAIEAENSKIDEYLAYKDEALLPTDLVAHIHRSQAK